MCGLRFGVWGLGFGDWGFGFECQGRGMVDSGFGFGDQGKGIQTPMAQGRPTKIISMTKWIRTSRT